MRVVIQRCSKASVSGSCVKIFILRNQFQTPKISEYLKPPIFFSVDDEVISSIGKGLCVLVGISRNDSKKDMDFMVRKLLNLRLFDDDSGKRWNHNVKDKGYEVLLVSQFTLYSVLKGNKPDFHSAMGPDSSEKFYSDFVAAMRQAYSEDLVKDGKFGAYMQVSIQNDGPVTINLESPGQSGKKTAEDQDILST